MAKVRVKVFGLRRGKRKITKAVDGQSMDTMWDIAKDLTRVASETAPLDKGDLEMSGTNDTNKVSDGFESWVKFEAWGTDPYNPGIINYAVWIHEEDYNLGERSLSKAGGFGLSGQQYEVGKKYLTRPLYGEAPTYRDMLDYEIKLALRKA